MIAGSSKMRCSTHIGLTIDGSPCRIIAAVGNLSVCINSCNFTVQRRCKLTGSKYNTRYCIRISAASDTVHYYRTHSQLTVIGLAARLTLDQSSQKFGVITTHYDRTLIRL